MAKVSCIGENLSIIAQEAVVSVARERSELTQRVSHATDREKHRFPALPVTDTH